MAELIGYLLTIDAIFTWALASLVYKAGLGKTNLKGTLLFRLCCVSLFTLIISLIFGSYLFFSNLKEDELIIYLLACLISGLTVTVGDLLYFNALKKIDVSRAYPIIQLSLIFVYPFAFFLFGEELTLSIFLGGMLILSGVFLLSKKDKSKEQEVILDESYTSSQTNKEEKKQEEVFIGVILAVGTAFLWALAIVAFHQARAISHDVYVTNFLRVIFATLFVAILGLFKREYYISFKKEERHNLKQYGYIGIAGSLSLGLADSLFYEAAGINGLILTSTLTASTPLVQQIFSILFLKEKFRKRFLIAVVLIILGNYLILFQ
ncbi:MAG: EamA family transporter [Promethearchaeota archaeon]|nr:MAG: EamA family transporter [Candidatus Lokiarchaeota archaeon]